MSDWAILGCGYAGTRLAKQLLAEGHRVRVCARNVQRLAPLGELGAEIHALDATKNRQFGPAMYGLRQPIIVYSIPPLSNMPQGEAIHRAGEAALALAADRFIYLSSTAVYGETEDGLVVDEETNIAISDPDAALRITEEMAVEAERLAGLSTVVLRLAAIYGPGRGVRERLRAGTYKLLDDGVHWYSRVHVDDLCGIIRAAARASGGSLYCVADDRPSTQREYVEWLCARVGVPVPPSQASMAPGAARRAVRNRKIANTRLHRELGYTFKYPSFVEGETAIEAEAGGVVAPAPPVPKPVETQPATNLPALLGDIDSACVKAIQALVAEGTSTALSNAAKLEAMRTALKELRS
jgi:nucleoside-diphosphate-sugar epimerase